MYKYVIMGIQGCGKGTQAKLLADELDLVHISVGDIFRHKIQDHDQMAQQLEQVMSAGHLVPDDLVINVVHDHLLKQRPNQGFILDGFPRNLAQARFLLDEYPIDSVINLKVPDGVVLERILARRACADCGTDWNLLFNPPQDNHTCDECGGPLHARDDDNERAVRSRLQDFHRKTEPILDIFKSRGLLVNVNGLQTVERVHDETLLELGLTVGV